MLPGSQPKYASVSVDERLRQGEILAGLIQVKQQLNSIGTTDFRVDLITHPFAIILTQDCELAQDFKLRSENGEAPALLENILFAETVTTLELKGKLPPGKDIWKRVIQNKDERYQCIEEVPAAFDQTSQGIPSLGCDFKRYFSVPTAEVYARIKLGQVVRRSRLITPYTEHLIQRFSFFQVRIPLPENHAVDMTDSSR